MRPVATDRVACVVCLSVGLEHAETSELIKMPFGMWTLGAQRTVYWMGARIPSWKGHSLLGHSFSWKLTYSKWHTRGQHSTMQLLTTVTVATWFSFFPLSVASFWCSYSRVWEESAYCNNISYSCQFYTNMRLLRISHIAAFFAHFSKVHILHIFSHINWHFPQQF